MAILDFPTNPTTGDIYNLDTRSWQWTGTAWKLLATNSINNTPVGNSTANTGAFTTLTVVGNITSSTGYILGNGALLTGVITSVANINSGTSNLRIESSGGNISANVGGVANVFGVTPIGANVTGNLAVTGNISAGNISAGNISANNYTGNGAALTGIEAGFNPFLLSGM
jgi:hypothetical protein